MWNKLWNEACSTTDREMFLRDAIDLWGYRILDRLGDGPEPERDPEVETLSWIYMRLNWIRNLPWEKIDKWIRKHCPSARELPGKWSFTGLIKEALREKMGFAAEV